MNYFRLIKWGRSRINERHLDANVAAYLLRRRLKWNVTHLLMNYRTRVAPIVLQQFKRDLNRYLAGEPPQYIIGTAPFYGYNFLVNRHVLIPRPETEGLVDWILHDCHQHSLRLVDVGTGSGAIAIALKLNRPRWQITASDISQPALNVAEKNALDHHAKVNFKRCDLFAGLSKSHYDVIVANPPYVAHSEIKEMDSDVFHWEPHLALFAPDHGLKMYQRIARNFADYLRPDGDLYLEIGFRQRSAVTRIFSRQKLVDSVWVRPDLAGHPRMVKVKLK